MFYRLLGSWIAGCRWLACRLIGHCFLCGTEYLAFVVIVVPIFETELARNQVICHALAAELPQLLRKVLLWCLSGFNARADPLLIPVPTLGHGHFPHEGMQCDALFDQRGIDHAPPKLELTVF